VANLQSFYLVKPGAVRKPNSATPPCIYPNSYYRQVLEETKGNVEKKTDQTQKEKKFKTSRMAKIKRRKPKKAQNTSLIPG